MNTQSKAIPESPLEPHAIPPAVISATRCMYWSVRRELWENRSLYLAPLAVAVLILVASLIDMIHLPAKLSDPSLNPAQQQQLIEQPFTFAALLLMFTTFFVGVFYCVDALQGERRDRTILFWKSLPVSDLTTVLSKASIPFVVLPLVTFAVTVVTQGIMLLLGSARLLGSSQIAPLWTRVSLFQMSGDAALPPRGRPFTLVGAALGLAASGLGLGAARDIPVGNIAAACDRLSREDHVQHFAFRRPAAAPLPRRPERRRIQREQHVDGFADTVPWSLPHHPGSLDWPGIRCGMPGSSGAAARQSGTNLNGRIEFHFSHWGEANMGTTVMMERTTEISPRLKARITGVFYLFTMLTGIFGGLGWLSFMYPPLGYPRP